VIADEGLMIIMRISDIFLIIMAIEAAAIKVRKEEFVCRQDKPFSSKKYYCTTIAEIF
jgi:hypothetical protein